MVGLSGADWGAIMPAALQITEKLAITMAVAAGATIFGLLFFIFIAKRFLIICPPNMLLVLSGGKRRTADDKVVGYRIIPGGRAWRVPVIETPSFMDMTTIPIYVAVQNAYSKNSIPLEVHAIANVKLASNPEIVMNAVERFLGRDRSEIQRVAKETLEGALRGVLARLTPEEINEDRLKFAAEISDEVEEDLAKLGLQVDTLKIQSVSDDKEYLDSIGRVRIAEAIKRAEIAESNARNEANKVAADSKALGDVAQEQAQKAILQKQNELRRIRADLAAQSESEEKKAVAAGDAARATAEQELQRIRSQLEQIRLQADVVIPWEAKRSQQEFEARAQAAPLAENGRAVAEALKIIAETWRSAGPDAKEIFLFQQLDQILGDVAGHLKKVNLEDVQILDPGDGRALPRLVAGYPAMVAAVLGELKASTGIDVPAILGRRLETAAQGLPPAGGAR
ncbi:MAG: flotillin family protein [Deltaproteobacteria bacterium]|nr:flotillin family protein [Deltaproteobacteria bacterium]